ncbi:MAG: HPF/RaiA family ribosome-associated protein, partial [Planctomycetota bacterium]|nr:HPF/RaiA family ribosome-associated protein [Planctomycetota bacterium]
MTIPIQINWCRVSPNDEVAAFIQDHVEALHSLFERLTACRVTLDSTKSPDHPANEFNVGIQLSVPRRELVIRQAADGDSTMKLQSTIAAAFSRARRKLQEYKRELQHGGD